MATKADFEELDVADDGSGDTILNGRPFSGIAYERNERGQLIGLAGFDRGGKHGPWREWYEDGRPKAEYYYYEGFRNGPWKEWSEDGEVTYDAYWECDFVIRRTRLDKDGLLRDRYDMTPEDRDFPKLEKRRGERSWIVVDIDLDTLSFVERPRGWGRDGSERV